jgi:hypothetical protein
MYRQAPRWYHAWHVMPRGFEPGDLVLQKAQLNKGKQKFLTPWEGLYETAQVLRPGTYKLKSMQGVEYKNAWNVEYLHRFYPWGRSNPTSKEMER